MNKQAQNTNRASEEFTEAARQAFEMLADHTVSLQEGNLRLTQEFFQNWIDLLQSQPEGTRQAAQAVRQHNESQQQALRELLQESPNAYSEFLASALSFYREAMSSAMQGAVQGMQGAMQGIQGSMNAAFLGVEAVSQAAQQSVQATRLAARSDADFDVLKDKRSLLEVAGSGGLDEEEARAFALEAVRQARADAERDVEAPAPSPEEVRARRASLTRTS